MTIIIHEESVTTNASKESIWELWKNVKEWSEWDEEVEWATLDGEFKHGQTGKLKPKGAPVSQFQITNCIPLQKFSDRAKLPLAILEFDHEITEEESERIVVKHRISITGPFARIFKVLLGKKLKVGLIKALPNLVRLAEKK